MSNLNRKHIMSGDTKSSLNPEFEKGLLDAVVYGIELYRIDDDGLKHIPVSDYIELD